MFGGPGNQYRNLPKLTQILFSACFVHFRSEVKTWWLSAHTVSHRLTLIHNPAPSWLRCLACVMGLSYPTQPFSGAVCVEEEGPSRLLACLHDCICLSSLCVWKAWKPIPKLAEAHTDFVFRLFCSFSFRGHSMLALCTYGLTQAHTYS